MAASEAARDPDRALEQLRREVGHQPGQPGTADVLAALQHVGEAGHVQRHRLVGVELATGDTGPAGQLPQDLRHPAEVLPVCPAVGQVLHGDRGDQQAQVVRGDAVIRPPGNVIHRPATATESRELGPVRLGQVPTDLQGAGEPLLFLGEQAEDSGPLGEQVLNALQGHHGEIQVRRGLGNAVRLNADLVDRLDAQRAWRSP
jgi:hypothetical protein